MKDTFQELDARVSILEAGNAAQRPQYCGVRQLASLLGKSPDWVYDHAEDLGGFKPGKGRKGRWSFHVESAQIYFERMGRPCSTQPPVIACRRPRRYGNQPNLLGPLYGSRTRRN